MAGLPEVAQTTWARTARKAEAHDTEQHRDLKSPPSAESSGPRLLTQSQATNVRVTCGRGPARTWRHRVMIHLHSLPRQGRDGAARQVNAAVRH